MPRKRKEPESGTSDEESDSCGTRSKLVKGQQPVQRHAANERERSRMRVLSKAFSKLKTTLPWVPSDTKLSKLDTLRLASSYIAHLQQLLDNEEEENGGTAIHPLNLTWPFSFNGKVVGGLESCKSDRGSSEDQAMDDLKQDGMMTSTTMCDR